MTIDPSGERAQARAAARAALGFGRGSSPPLRRSVQRAGGWYPLVALGLLVIVDEFQAYGFFVLGPEISAALGVSPSVLAGLVALKTVALTSAALPMAAWLQRRPRRDIVAISTAFGWSIATMATGFITGVWGLTLVLLADGATSGSVNAVHAPLLVDSYRPDARVRALAAHRAFGQTGNIIAPLLVALLVGPLLLTWRGVFIVMGCVSLLAALAAVRLRDPGYGRFDEEVAGSAVASVIGGGAPTEPAEAELGFGEAVRRLLLVPTIRRFLSAYAVLGTAIIPLFTFLFFFLEDRWDVGPAGRGLFFAAMPPFSIVALILFARRGESMFSTDPARLVRITGLLIAGGTVALAVAIFTPVFVLMAALLGVGLAMLTLAVPALNVSMLSLVTPRLRPHASALAGVSLAAVGGFGGLVLLGSIDRRFGTGGAIASLAVPGLIAAIVLFAAARTIVSDLDDAIDRIVASVQADHVRRSGASVPLLDVSGVDHAYGPLQVLFDVDLRVEDGEMLALLGTNGAGKSTLLRIISGLAFPTRGSVRLDGADVTFVSADRRVAAGITTVPGGRAVFPTLSVIDNLRLSAYSLGRNARVAQRRIDEVFEAFPVLAERRDQRASTLSGGEQQMLGIGKALILGPRLLLIDELTLGLGPIIVAELLETVRRINAAGTAVVIVEQSVNVALSLVDHAYFMDKGEIRFDGRAEDLLARPDLLRSVFLERAVGRDPGDPGTT